MHRTQDSEALRVSSMQPPRLSLEGFQSPMQLRQNQITVSAQEIPKVMRTPPLPQSCTTTQRKRVSMAAISGICAPLESASAIQRQNRHKDRRLSLIHISEPTRL